MTTVYGPHGFWSVIKADIRANLHQLGDLLLLLVNYKRHKGCQLIRFERVTEFAGKVRVRELSWIACRCGRVFWSRRYGTDARELARFKLVGKWPNVRVDRNG